MTTGGRRLAAVLGGCVLLVTGLSAAAPAQAATPQPTPADCTIFVVDGTAVGTDGDDVICGTEGDDVIVGGGGDDTIFGLGGNDYIDASAGADWISGGYGADEIVMGPGDDYANGGPDADRLWGGAGIDDLVGGSGDDSLIGETGADDLDGGVGVDYCKKDSSDTTTSCYFDTAKPTMVSLAVGTPTLDTSAAARVVAVRVRVHDAGTGVARIDLTFGRHLTTGAWVNEFHLVAETEGAEHSCTAASHAYNPTYEADTKICLVAGTPRDGVYELRTLLPRWSPQGTYRLNDVRLRDSATNWGGLYWEQLVDKRMAVGFKQVGAGDALAPLVRSIGTLTPSVNTSAASRTIGVRLRVTDATSGLAGLRVGWARVVRDELGSVSEYRWPQPEFGFSTEDLPSCAEGIPTPDELYGGQREWACRESGTLQDGWYRLYSVLPRWSGKGSYELVTLITSDRAGNQKVMTDGEIIARGLSRHIYQSGDGDEAPAYVSAVTVMTPRVTTGDAGAEVVLRVRAKDAVSGVDGLFVDMAPADSSVRQGLSFSSSNQPCGPDTAEACLLSGTVNDGVWQLKATLPAHAAAGTWRVVSVIANDQAGNTRQWWSSFGAYISNS